jgi:hypothetical protein
VIRRTPAGTGVHAIAGLVVLVTGLLAWRAWGPLGLFLIWFPAVAAAALLAVVGSVVWSMLRSRRGA